MLFSEPAFIASLFESLNYFHDIFTPRFHTKNICKTSCKQHHSCHCKWHSNCKVVGHVGRISHVGGCTPWLIFLPRLAIYACRDSKEDTSTSYMYDHVWCNSTMKRTETLTQTCGPGRQADGLTGAEGDATAYPSKSLWKGLLIPSEPPFKMCKNTVQSLHSG